MRSVIMGRQKVALLPSEYIAIGGIFTGTNQNRLALFDIANNLYATQNFTLNGEVRAIVKDSSKYYIGGAFTNYIAEIDISTFTIGYSSDYNPSTNLASLHISNYNGNLFAGNAPTTSYVNYFFSRNPLSRIGSTGTGFTINSICSDTTCYYYIGYARTTTTTPMIRNYPATLSKNLATGVGYAIQVDGNLLYCGGSFANKFEVYNKTDFSVVSGYPTFTGNIRAIEFDANYIYIAGLSGTGFQVISKSTLTVIHSSNTSTNCYALTQDANYVYLGANTSLIKISKSDFSSQNTLLTLNSAIYALCK